VEDDSSKEKELKYFTINTFTLLDVDCDSTLYRDELTDLWSAMNKISETKKQMDWVHKMKNEKLAMDQYGLKALLKEADEQGIKPEEVSTRVYSKRVGILGCCPCRFIRGTMIGARFDRITAEEAHYGWMSVMSDFGIQMVHLFDLITDFTLAVQMYVASRPEEEQQRWQAIWGNAVVDGHGKNYDVAFIWIMMAIFGPYIIQFSSMINAFFVKGIFED